MPQPKNFWESYVPESREFVTKEEKQRLANDEEPFDIVNVKTNKGRFGEEYNIFIQRGDGSKQTMTFSAGSVQSRDDVLDQMIAYFKEPDAESVAAQIESVDTQGGNSVYLVKAVGGDEGIGE